MLAPGDSQLVTFPSWTAGPLGMQAISCTTHLIGDTNPANDTANGMVTVVQTGPVCGNGIIETGEVCD
jgi:hypothetical protein